MDDDSDWKKGCTSGVKRFESLTAPQLREWAKKNPEKIRKPDLTYNAMTALIAAAKMGDVDLVRYLLRTRDADPNGGWWVVDFSCLCFPPLSVAYPLIHPPYSPIP